MTPLLLTLLLFPLAVVVVSIVGGLYSERRRLHIWGRVCLYHWRGLMRALARGCFSAHLFFAAEAHKATKVLQVPARGRPTPVAREVLPWLNN